MKRPADLLMTTAIIASVVVLPGVRLGAERLGGPEKLGTVTFPISCAPEVQSAFERGVALLHSFQYEEATRTFDEIGRQDARCAMGHWGKAMTLYHQLWDWPTPRRLSESRRELARARALGPRTPRERAYIAAAETFFQRRHRNDHAARIQAYSRALAALHRDFPSDHEATAFYALSLVALAGENVDRLANLRQAIGLLQPLLREQPNHPGAAHYLIHAADTPDLAPQGLDAATVYADIAPDSSHALHMPSHIFVRLGMWSETIASNLRAAAAGAQAVREHRGDANYQLHAMDYLAYAYLQDGEESKARAVIQQLDDVPGASSDDLSDRRAYFAARAALELHRWAEASALPVPTLRPALLSDTYQARAIGAALNGDVAAARHSLTQLREAVRSRKAGRRKEGYEVSANKPVDLAEAEAFVMFAEGRVDEALPELRRAADQEDAEGDELLGVPAREMLGDLLLDLKRPAEALEAYRTVLKAFPNRFNALFGAARAARLARDIPASQEYRQRLLAVAAPDGDRPEIQEVKAAALNQH